MKCENSNIHSHKNLKFVSSNAFSKQLNKNNLFQYMKTNLNY